MKVYYVSMITLKEFLKAKILLWILILGALLMLMTFVATQFTYGVPAKVCLDIGLGFLNITTVGIAIFLGVGLIFNEIESRTLYVVLTRSITRMEFILGKLIGLTILLFFNTILLSLLILLTYRLFTTNIDLIIYKCIFFIFLESLLVLGIVVLFSLITNKILSVLFTLSLWGIGHGIFAALNTKLVQTNDLLRNLLNLSSLILPAFYKLNIKDYVLYEGHMPEHYFLWGVFYSILYTLSLFVMIVILFQKKDLD